jgi:hypothetical protein
VSTFVRDGEVITILEVDSSLQGDMSWTHTCYAAAEDDDDE